MKIKFNCFSCSPYFVYCYQYYNKKRFFYFVLSFFDGSTSSKCPYTRQHRMKCCVCTYTYTTSYGIDPTPTTNRRKKARSRRRIHVGHERAYRQTRSRREESAAAAVMPAAPHPASSKRCACARSCRPLAGGPPHANLHLDLRRRGQISK